MEDKSELRGATSNFLPQPHKVVQSHSKIGYLHLSRDIQKKHDKDKQSTSQYIATWSCIQVLKLGITHILYELTCWFSQGLLQVTSLQPNLGSAEVFALLSIASTTRILPLYTIRLAHESLLQFGSFLLLTNYITALGTALQKVSFLTRTPTLAYTHSRHGHRTRSSPRYKVCFQNVYKV